MTQAVSIKAPLSSVQSNILPAELKIAQQAVLQTVPVAAPNAIRRVDLPVFPENPLNPARINILPAELKIAQQAVVRPVPVAIPNTIQRVDLPVFPENPLNPARINIVTGEMEINRQAFDRLTPAQQDFFIEHEIGHYTLKTTDEIAADRFALDKIALESPNSLWNSYTAVRDVASYDEERLSAMQVAVLGKSAEAGDSDAQAMLQEIGIDVQPLKSESTNKKKASKISVEIVFVLVAVVLLTFYFIKK